MLSEMDGILRDNAMEGIKQKMGIFFLKWTGYCEIHNAVENIRIKMGFFILF